MPSPVWTTVRERMIGWARQHRILVELLPAHTCRCDIHSCDHVRHWDWGLISTSEAWEFEAFMGACLTLG